VQFDVRQFEVQVVTLLCVVQVWVHVVQVSASATDAPINGAPNTETSAMEIPSETRAMYLLQMFIVISPSELKL
jgi:hypothetical protein